VTNRRFTAETLEANGLAGPKGDRADVVCQLKMGRVHRNTLRGNFIAEFDALRLHDRDGFLIPRFSP
jgi:hypothetical protein